MKSLTAKTTRMAGLLLGLAALFCAGIAAPNASGALTPATDSIKVVNDSGRVITHLYLSQPNEDSWTPDLLNDTKLNPGQSFTLGSVTCNGSEIRVIGEDADGCFVSAIVSCTGEVTWTITNEAVPNCGN